MTRVKKQCVKCLEWKPFNKFPHHKQKYHGRLSVCIKCREEIEKRKAPEAKRKRTMEYCRQFRETIKGQYANFKQNKSRHKRHTVNLTLEQFEQVISEAKNKCYYCGVELNRTRGHKHSRTIDRKDNNKQYTFGNVVVSCRRCNMIKNDCFTAEEMLEIAEKYIKPKLADYLSLGF